MKIAGQPQYTPPAKRGPVPADKTVPPTRVEGHSTVGVVPGMPGTFRVGENKNVSTPVSG